MPCLISFPALGGRAAAARPLAMSARVAKGMDPLGDLPSDSDSDAPCEATAAPATWTKTDVVDYESLRRHGMKTAPTLEGIRDDEGGEGNWGWSRGARSLVRDSMTGEELHEATNAGLERACARSIEVAEEKRKARAADRESRRAEGDRRRRREKETRAALREDDTAARANADEVNAKRARNAVDLERGRGCFEKDSDQEEKRDAT